MARIGAGAVLGEIYAGLAPDGLTIPGGTCPSVGIAGLTLGGGLGLLGRRDGPTCDRLVGATIVLADGRMMDCDEHHDGDLFWALRGAGAGRFGVVTELRFRPVPLPAVVTSFRLTWSFEHAADLVSAWIEWSPQAPDELAASLLVTASSDLEQGPTVEVGGAMLGGTSDARALLDTSHSATPRSVDRVGRGGLPRRHPADHGRSRRRATGGSRVFDRSPRGAPREV